MDSSSYLSGKHWRSDWSVRCNKSVKKPGDNWFDCDLFLAFSLFQPMEIQVIFSHCWTYRSFIDKKVNLKLDQVKIWSQVFIFQHWINNFRRLLITFNNVFNIRITLDFLNIKEKETKIYTNKKKFLKLNFIK